MSHAMRIGMEVEIEALWCLALWQGRYLPGRNRGTRLKPYGVSLMASSAGDHRAGEETIGETRALAGRRALVTGASGGIGAAIARRLGELGVGVALTARSADKLEALAADLGRQRVSVLAIEADMTDRDSLAAVIDGVGAHWGGLDILVNDAGLPPRAKPATEVSWAEWDNVIGLNLSAPWYLACRARELMGPGGVIVNNASTASYYPSRGLVAYNVSKSALVMLTRVLALEWAHEGIQVVGVAPGKIEWIEDPAQVDVRSDLALQVRGCAAGSQAAPRRTGD
jgi:NAD(P)-dependent dehydrogenase (short-subunit alcohol dehydrogenase family)